MPDNTDRPCENLEQLFHAPNRLAILSALCAADNGMPFTELRDACGLTDGNLNRHLKVLDEASVVRIRKRFVDAKPCTTITLSKQGLARFSDYLNALHDVLAMAQAAMQPDPRPETLPPGQRVRA